MAQKAGIHRLAFQTDELHATCRQCDEPHPARLPLLSLPHSQRSGIATIRSLLPYLWPEHDPGTKARVVLAMCLLLVAKLATVAVPVIYGRIVDALAPKDNTALLAIPLGAGDRLRPAARRLRRVRRTAGRAVRQGAAAGGPHRGAAHLPASACAQPALPSRPPDRRAGACDRPRLAGHPVGAAACGVQRGADGDRTAAGHRDHLAPVRLALRRHHLQRGGELRRLHHELRRVALAHPAHDERHRQRCKHQGARQPAELRDGEVFRQRAARGGALRRRSGALRSAPRCGCRCH